MLASPGIPEGDTLAPSPEIQVGDPWWASAA